MAMSNSTVCKIAETSQGSLQALYDIVQIKPSLQFALLLQAILSMSSSRSRSISRTAMGPLPDLGESPTDSILSTSVRVPLSQLVRKSAPIEMQASAGSGAGRKPPAWGAGAAQVAPQVGVQAAAPEGTSPPSGPSFRNIQVRPWLSQKHSCAH